MDQKLIRQVRNKLLHTYYDEIELAKETIKLITHANKEAVIEAVRNTLVGQGNADYMNGVRSFSSEAIEAITRALEVEK